MINYGNREPSRAPPSIALQPPVMRANYDTGFYESVLKSSAVEEPKSTRPLIRMLIDSSKTKTLFFALTTCYFFAGMHFFMHNPGGTGLYLPFNVIGWIYASLVIALGLWQATANGAVVYSRLLISMGAGAVLLAIPAFYGVAPFAESAIPRLLALFAGVAFLFALYQFRLSRTQRISMLYVILIAAAIEALFGLSQYYLLKPGNWIGYDTVRNLPYGIFQQRNVMATFMTSGMATSMWLLANTSDRPRAQNWLLYGFLGLASLLLVLLQSRVGQLTGLAGLALLGPALYHRGSACLARVLVAIFVGITVGWLSQWLSVGPIRALDDLQSGHFRATIWNYSIRLIASSPWMGLGYGAFESAFLKVYAAARMSDPSTQILPSNVDHPHNEVLYWAVEGGVLGIAGILLIGYAALRAVRGRDWRSTLGLFALPLPILMHTQLEYPLYHSVAHWLVLLLLLYFVDTESGTSNSIVYKGKLLFRFLAIATPAIVVPFMITSLHTAWIITKYERGSRNPLLLMKVVNPIPWLSRFQSDVNTINLASGLKVHNTAGLESYLKWAEAFVAQTPRAEIYTNMIVALRALGRPEVAEELRKKAHQYYPDDEILSGNAPLSIRSAPAGN